MTTPTITLTKLNLAYGNRQILANINLTLQPNRWTALLGTSGIGKSSLLRLIAGLTSPLAKMSGQCYASNNLPVSDQVAYMPQADSLLPWLTVIENATLKLRLRHYTQTAKHSETEKAHLLLSQTGLAEAKDLFPHELSGGMRQRVALIRTLLENKPIILMDEPFSALDTLTRHTLQQLAVTLLANKTVFFITHDPQEAIRLAHEIYIMRGHPAQVHLYRTLDSPIPRALTQPDTITLQASLFNELSLPGLAV